MDIILKITIIVAGIILILGAVIFLAMRKQNEAFSIIWGITGAVTVALGIVIKPVNLEQYIGMPGFILLVVLGILLLCAAVSVTWLISSLMRKKIELAMHLSLAEKEIEELKARMERIETEQIK